MGVKIDQLGPTGRRRSPAPATGCKAAYDHRKPKHHRPREQPSCGGNQAIGIDEVEANYLQGAGFGLLSRRMNIEPAATNSEGRKTWNSANAGSNG
jgi:hypothetical protein